MKLIGVPKGQTIKVHKATCRDLREDARFPNGKPMSYDDVYHVDAETREEAVRKMPYSPSVVFVGCTKPLK